MKVFKKFFTNNSMARIANDFIQICTQEEEEEVTVTTQIEIYDETLFDVPTPEAKRKSFDATSSCKCSLKPVVDNRVPKLSVTSMECPICFEDFKPSTKIYQCLNGHLYCGACKPQLTCLSCPQCRQPIPEEGIRNVFLEKIIQRIYEKKP